MLFLSSSIPKWSYILSCLSSIIPRLGCGLLVLSLLSFAIHNTHDKTTGQHKNITLLLFQNKLHYKKKKKMRSVFNFLGQPNSPNETEKKTISNLFFKSCTVLANSTVFVLQTVYLQQHLQLCNNSTTGREQQ